MYENPPIIETLSVSSLWAPAGERAEAKKQNSPTRGKQSEQKFEKVNDQKWRKRNDFCLAVNPAPFDLPRGSAGLQEPKAGGNARMVR